MIGTAAHVERYAFRLIGGFGLFFLVAPMLVIVLASLDPGPFFQFPPRTLSLYWYRQFLQDENWTSAIEFTLTVSALTAVVNMIIGGLAGIAIARLSPTIRRFAYLAVITPLAVPAIVLAIALYGVVLQLHFVGQLASFVVADTLITAPLATLLVTASALGIDQRLEFASLACGMGPWRTLWRITMPLVFPSVMVGGGLAFLVSLDEVVLSSFLVGPGATPVAVLLFLEIQTGSTPVTTAVATFLIVLSTVTIGAIAAIVGTLLARRRSAITLSNIGVVTGSDIQPLPVP